MFCPKCGVQNADDSKFCIDCGGLLRTEINSESDTSKQTQTEEAQIISFRKCGTQNEDDAKFCNNCGEALKAEISNQAAESEQEQAEEMKIIICKKCGAQNAKDAQFCNKCGAKFTPDIIFCINCGLKVEDDSVFCNKCGTKITQDGINNIQSIPATQYKQQPVNTYTSAVITGNFPFVQTKEPIALLVGEQVILQEKGLNLTGNFSVEGTLTLTNMRILWKRISGVKSLLKGGSIIGAALDASKDKAQSFDLGSIISINKYTLLLNSTTVFEFVTNDGASYKFQFVSNLLKMGKAEESRNMTVDLIQQTINQR